jgi:hypothetical protein
MEERRLKWELRIGAESRECGIFVCCTGGEVERNGRSCCEQYIGGRRKRKGAVQISEYQTYTYMHTCTILLSSSVKVKVRQMMMITILILRVFLSELCSVIGHH